MSFMLLRWSKVMRVERVEGGVIRKVREDWGGKGGEEEE
jgi:hypothetical protein